MSIAIGDNSALGALTTTDVNTTKKTQQLESSLKTNLDNATDDQLMDVCKNFESYMVEQMFKEMKKTVHSEDDENQYISYFGDTLYQKYADDVVESGGMGIAQMLYESMKRN